MDDDIGEDEDEMEVVADDNEVDEDEEDSECEHESGEEALVDDGVLMFVVCNCIANSHTRVRNSAHVETYGITYSCMRLEVNTDHSS